MTAFAKLEQKNEPERISVDEYRRLVAEATKATTHREMGGKSLPHSRPKLRIPKPRREATDIAILERITRRLSTRNLKLKPEEALSIAFADALRVAVVQGRLRAVFTHPANEIAGRRSGLSKIRYTIAKAMGLIDGTADYLFLWSTGSGALEAKIGRNGQQDNQLDFEWWCHSNGVHYRIFTSVEEGLEILQDWGILT